MTYHHHLPRASRSADNPLRLPGVAARTHARRGQARLPAGLTGWMAVRNRPWGFVRKSLISQDGDDDPVNLYGGQVHRGFGRAMSVR